MQKSAVIAQMAERLRYDLEDDDDAAREELELYADSAIELARHYTNVDDLPDELCPCVSQIAVGLMCADSASYIRLGDLTVEGDLDMDERMRELHRFRVLSW